jgi:hypothetical protein
VILWYGGFYEEINEKYSFTKLSGSYR